MRVLSIDQIISDNNWNLMEVELGPKREPLLSKHDDFLFACNYNLDKCEIMIGSYNPFYSHPGGGIPSYETWVGGTIRHREEISMDEVVAWAEPESVTAYFSFEKGSCRLRDFMKLNERFYADTSCRDGDSVYAVRLLLYYHILPSEFDSMQVNGFVDIAGGISSDAACEFIFDRIEI